MSRDTTTATTLEAFYRERFNSDPFALVDFFFREIEGEAASVGIRWDSIADKIRFTGKKETKGIGVFEKRHKSKVVVWADLKRTRTGLDLPALTFLNSAEGGLKSFWSGYGALYELFTRERGNVADAKHAQWLERQAAKKAEREAAQAEAIRKAQVEAQRRAAEAHAYEVVFAKGGAQSFEYNDRGDLDTVELVTDASVRNQPYFIAKDIAAIADVIDARVMRDRHGIFVALRVHNVDGDYCGLQRLYANFKRYTVAGFDGAFTGAHCVIGDLETAERRYSVEGFATGASVYLAEAAVGNDVAVIVTMTADNLPVVVGAYRQRDPDVAIVNAADHDAHKPKAGNKGLRQALTLARDFSIKSVVPPFESLDDVGGEPTDWNDYYRLAGAEACAAALRARESVFKVEGDLFCYSVQRLRYCGQQGIENEALRAITCGMLLVPAKLSTRDVYNAVVRALPSALEVNKVRLFSRAKWLAERKMTEAAELRGFSQAALEQDNVDHIKVPAAKGQHGEDLVPDHIVHLCEAFDGMVIVRAPMGSGKTERLIAPLMQRAPKAGYIAHRISLIGDAANRLGVDHYQQVNAFMMPYVSRLACCVNSITKKVFENYDGQSWFSGLDTLCIDEASQVIRHTVLGTVSNPVRVFDALIDSIASARRVLLCDADANDLVIELCKLARPGEKIRIIEVEGSASHIRVDHTSGDVAWQMALDAATKGERVLVASDGADKAQQLAVAIHKARPEARILVVHKDSKADKRVEAFLENPNAEQFNYDVLLYSPAISSGVSMKDKHFERHFGLFSGMTVTPSDAVQMLRRDRAARHYVLGLGINNTTRETDREALYRGLVAADEALCEFLETESEVILRRPKTQFDEIHLAAKAAENRARNGFNNNLLLMLAAEGYKLGRLEVSEEYAATAKANREFARDLVWSQYVDRIHAQPTPDEATYQRLSRQEVRSEDEAAQLDRYAIENQLCVDKITDADIEFYDEGHGVKAIAALELVQSTEEQARAYDRAQQRANVVMSRHRWKSTPRRLWLRIFDILGVDPLTGLGTITSKACRTAAAEILATKESTELYNTLGIGPYVKPGTKPKCATTWVKGIFKRFGLTLKKSKVRGSHRYSVNRDKWGEVSYYLELRAAKGVHSLTTFEQAASVHEPKVTETADEASNGAASEGGDTLHSDIRLYHQVSPLLSTVADAESFVRAVSRHALPGNISVAKLCEAAALDEDVVKGVLSGALNKDYLASALVSVASLCAKIEGIAPMQSAEVVDTVIAGGIIGKLATGEIDETYAAWLVEFAAVKMGLKPKPAPAHA